MYEVKADALESSFETVERNGDVAALREEVSGLKRRLDQALVAGGRPVLGEAKADNARPEVKAFVDRYLRKGLEQGVELKAFQGTTPGDGGYAVPREIDSVIEATLNSISPIRAIANVVSVGSAGYRKLVTTGGVRSEEHTSELQSLMRISYAVFCLKKKNI